jgi:hypothetical protein
MEWHATAARYLLGAFGCGSRRGRWSSVACYCRWVKKMVVLLVGPSKGGEMGPQFAPSKSLCPAPAGASNDVDTYWCRLPC